MWLALMGSILEYRAASGGGAHARQHPAANGHASEASQLQYLQRRITAAEADAEGARMELLRACQQAERSAADVARCKGLEQRLQVRLRLRTSKSVSEKPVQSSVSRFRDINCDSSVMLPKV